MTIQSIALNRLVQSKANVRRTGKTEGIAELMASIVAVGLRQNLNVKPTSGGRYEVVAGGRRLIALKRLAKEGRVEPDLPVPCRVLAEGDDAVEISLTENAVRQAMHPDDQFVAFSSLVEAGVSVEDVAARFGVTPVVVRQRMKLAAVSPKLRAAYRAGDMDLEQLMAFALVDDHARQEEVWVELPEWNRDAQTIRHVLTRQAVPVTAKLAKFVGEEAYLAAGGAILRDLFDTEHGGYLLDTELVNRLADEKLQVAAAIIKAEGWAWVATMMQPDYSMNYGRVYPQAAEEGGERVFLSEDIARAGARLTIGYDGSLSVERGLIDPTTLRAEKTPQKPSGEARGANLPDSVVEELTAHRTAALRARMQRNPGVALAAVVHALVLDTLYDHAYDVASSLDIHAKQEGLERHIKHPDECSAHAEAAAELTEWAERLPADPADLWAWCVEQNTETLLALLAVVAASTINAVRMKTDHATAPRLQHADRLAEALALDMAGCWTPKADGFYARLSKAALAKVLDEAGQPFAGAGVLRLKKAEAAHHTARALAGKGWLPSPLRTAPAACRAKAAESGDDERTAA